MGVVVGGEKAWKVKQKGDIVVAFHWVNREPAMVLFPMRPNTALKPTACVIPLESAHKYANSNGYPTQYCVQQAGKYALLMGMYNDSFTVHRIAEAILEGIEDLLDMPPEPRAFERRGRTIGELTLRSGGKEIGSATVDEDLNIELPGPGLH